MMELAIRWPDPNEREDATLYVYRLRCGMWWRRLKEQAMRDFSLAQILTVTTGRLLCEVGDVYDILNYMTNDNLFTHQLSRASDEAKPEILRQHPALADITGDDVTSENWNNWLAVQIQKHGEQLVLEPLGSGEHIHVHPVDEAVVLTGDPKKVIAIDIDQAEV